MFVKYNANKTSVVTTRTSNAAWESDISKSITNKRLLPFNTWYDYYIQSQTQKLINLQKYPRTFHK